MEHFSHYFIADTWYQTVVLYTLIAALIYANFALIRIGERKKARAAERSDEFRDA